MWLHAVSRGILGEAVLYQWFTQISEKFFFFFICRVLVVLAHLWDFLFCSKSKALKHFCLCCSQIWKKFNRNIVLVPEQTSLSAVFTGTTFYWKTVLLGKQATVGLFKNLCRDGGKRRISQKLDKSKTKLCVNCITLKPSLHFSGVYRLSCCW